MDPSRDFRLYLSPKVIRQAEAGQHGFIARLTGVLQAHGYRVELCRTGREARALAPTLPGWAMYRMEHPTHDRALVFRKVYHSPFWAIETTAARWRWPVAQAGFPRRRIDPAKAAEFHARWQQKLFGDAPRRASRDGFVYLPLQGRLCEHRSFQDCAPLEMLERTLAREKTRKLLVTLHPKEVYTPEDLTALEDLCRRFPRLEMVQRPMAEMLQHCDYVVTENSSAAFFGFFFGKPAITFARIDFHHICLGQNDFDRVAEHAPEYDRYIWWFWQKMALNLGRPAGIDQKIAERLARCGLPMDPTEVPMKKGTAAAVPFMK